MEKNTLERIKEELVEGKLPCEKAFNLAEELEITPKEIGKICNQEGIRIKKCQLGCF